MLYVDGYGAIKVPRCSMKAGHSDHNNYYAVTLCIKYVNISGFKHRNSAGVGLDGTIVEGLHLFHTL